MKYHCDSDDARVTDLALRAGRGDRAALTDFIRATQTDVWRLLAHLGGATLDNEENYLAKKLFTAAGAVQMENQARI